MKSVIWINGKLMKEDKACVSVFDRGFSYGDGVFETLKANDGVPLYLDEHLKRLKTGLDFLKIPAKDISILKKSAGRKIIQKLLNANRLLKAQAYIKIIVTRGVDKGAHLPSKGISPTVIIIAKPINAKLVEKLQQEGIKAAALRGAYPAMPQIKSLNYLPSVAGKMEAAAKKTNEGIFVLPGEKATEGTSSNLFIVKNGTVFTPPSKKVLPGITRGVVLKIARKHGIKAIEKDITLKELMGSDEAFMTNSIMDLAPLVSFDKKPVGAGKPGPVTRLLQGVYQAHTQGAAKP